MSDPFLAPLPVVQEGWATLSPESNESTWGDRAAVVSILESAVDGVLTCRESGTIQAINRSGARLFGYEPHELIGQNVSLLVPREIAGEHTEYLTRFVRTGESQIVGTGREVRGTHKDGSTVNVYLSIGHVRRGDQHTFTAVLQDRADLCRARARLQEAKDAAEAASRAKSEFMANISHELRTPLHGILSVAKFGTDDCVASEHDTFRQHFHDINQCATTLLTLVDDLLDLEKLEVGKMSFCLATSDLRPLVSSVVDGFRSLCSERSLSIMLDMPADAVWCVVDGERIRQVVRNLLANAVKFAPSASVVFVKVECRDESARFSVQDQGPGIKPDELELIFERFFQSSRGNSKSGGTGLGLSICREIVKAHRGTLWAENGRDCGAVFHCELPLVSRKSVASQGGDAEPSCQVKASSRPGE